MINMNTHQASIHVGRQSSLNPHFTKDSSMYTTYMISAMNSTIQKRTASGGTSHYTKQSTSSYAHKI